MATYVKPTEVKVIRFKALTLSHKFEDEKDSATFVWSVRAGYPRVTVYTTNNRIGDNIDYGKVIIAPLSYDKLYSFIRSFKKVLKDNPETEYAIECLNLRFVNNVRTDEKYLQATIHIGKDKDGLIYIAATEDKKKKIRFYFRPSTWHRDKVNGDYIVDKAALSRDYAESYIKRLETSFDISLKDTIVYDKIPAPGAKR